MNTLRILDKTKQQRLDYLQSKIYLLQQLGMSEDDYKAKRREVGEDFIRQFWGNDYELRLQIENEDRLGFWEEFNYQWAKRDISIVEDFMYKNIHVNRNIYAHLQCNYLTANLKTITTILYVVHNNIIKYYGKNRISKTQDIPTS